MTIEDRDKGDMGCMEGIRFRGRGHGRNEVSRSKETGFVSQETGFIQLRCEYGTMMVQ